jgi:general secretion pathway protein G
MKRRKRKIRRGFTMVELMAVLVILGLLATVLVRNFMGQTDKARVTTTKVNLRLLHQAVMQFKMDTTRFPTEEEGLSVLIEAPSDVTEYQPGGYLDTTDIPKDGWRRDFEYRLWPDSGKQFEIISYGADGEDGGEGYDADLRDSDPY